MISPGFSTSSGHWTRNFFGASRGELPRRGGGEGGLGHATPFYVPFAFLYDII